MWAVMVDFVVALIDFGVVDAAKTQLMNRCLVWARRGRDVAGVDDRLCHLWRNRYC